jgi:predicted nucleic acid-binding protein
VIRYFDSSFILAQLLGEQTDRSAAEIWRSTTKCLASNLLVIESLIAIRRTARVHAQRAGGESWVRERIAALDRLVGNFDLKAVDRSIEETIRKTPLLAECRTLDAIHLATALHFKPVIRGALEIVTLDGKMAAVARKLGLAVMRLRIE